MMEYVVTGWQEIHSFDSFFSHIISLRIGTSGRMHTLASTTTVCIVAITTLLRARMNTLLE